MALTIPLAAPNQADFITFLQDAGFNSTVLPTTSSVIPFALGVALDIVNSALNDAVPDIYVLAVYNLGADNIVRFAQDQTGQTFFADLRTSLNIDAFSPGVTSSTSDESTSESLLNPKFMEGLSLMDLQNLKTPWGRQYLMFAQMYGPTIWGLS